MSKAFMRESDDAPARPLMPQRAASLPPGAPHYITPAGARRFRELPPNVVVVPPPSEPTDQVRFGATVTVRDQDGETVYRIVGVDEVDLDRNWISWVSPLAKALLNARVGQRVRFRNDEIEILRVNYERI